MPGAAILVGLLLIAGCAPGHRTTRMTGIVTTVQPRLCLGLPEAQGSCFATTARQLDGITVGQCVTVIYDESGSPRAIAKAVTVDPVSDCP